MHLEDYRHIVFFDGVCTLCNGAVDFIMRSEKGDELKMASLQSELGEQLFKKYRENGKIVPDSIILYSDGTFYERSAAVLHISRFLVWPYSWLRFFGVVPVAIRDRLYSWIASNRYKWFGKRETCRVPTPEERAKFLS